MEFLFVCKELIVGAAKIIWAVVGFFLMDLIVYPVCFVVMWTLTKLGLWHYPAHSDPNGHFQWPWKSS